MLMLTTDHICAAVRVFTSEMKSHPTTDTNHSKLGPKWYEDKQQEDDTTQAWQCDMLPQLADQQSTSNPAAGVRHCMAMSF